MLRGAYQQASLFAFLTLSGMGCLGTAGEATNATLNGSTTGGLTTETGGTPNPSTGSGGTVGTGGTVIVGSDGNTVVVGGDTTTAPNTTTPAQAAEGGPPAVSRGATVPYWTLEAEAAKTTGTVLPPVRTFGEVTNESSGRSAVKLTATGQYIEFTTPAATNSIVVRYSMPDAPNGGGMTSTLGIYVGAERKILPLTSRYAWTYGSPDAQNQGSENPGNGTPHHFYDDAHMMFDTVPAGTVIRVQRDAQDNATYYVIDLVEFELVAAPIAQPAGSLSVLDFGATPDDGTDDSVALQAAIDAGRTQKKVVYIPKGVFTMPAYQGKGSQSLKLNIGDVTIQGAGMWHSVIQGFSAMFQLSGAPVKLADFALFGDVTYRDDNMGWQGMDGPAGKGSTMTNLWLEHHTAGYWCGMGANKPPITAPLTDGLMVRGLRVRNLHADGINLANATANSVVEQSTFRNTGDDSMASWSNSGDGPLPTTNNVFRFNTAVAPWRASCMVLYGGANNSITDNVCMDTSVYPGLSLQTTHNAMPFTGTVIAARNSLLRAGGMNYNQGFGALRLFTDSQPISNLKISDILIEDPTYSGIHFNGGLKISDVTMDNITVKNYGTVGIWVAGECQGNVTMSNVAVQGTANKGLQNDAPNSFTLTRGTGNVGW